MTSISYVINMYAAKKKKKKKKKIASSVNYDSNNVTKLKILKRLKETNQTKSLVALLDLLINQVFLVLTILKVALFFCITFFLKYKIPKDFTARYQMLQKKTCKKYQNNSTEEKRKKATIWWGMI